MKEFFKAIYKLAEKCVVKSIKIDLRSGTYKVLFLDKREPKPSTPLFNDWVKNSCNNGLVHPEYIEEVCKTFTIENISKILKYKKYMHYKFKRSICKNGEYKDYVLTIIPCEKDSCYLIIYDIGE